MDLVREYMEIAYTPGKASAKAVAPLCAPDNKLIAPTTFPTARTLEEYAQVHGEMLEAVNDLHFVSFDEFFAQGDRVCLRYTAEGSHSGKAHSGIAPTGNKARWSASAIFRVEDGKLKEFIKDWNKLHLWQQLGWPLQECLVAK